MITSDPSSHLLRSVLSVPAINQKALDKARMLDCDAVILDLEDSVAPEKKGEARDNLRRFFADGGFGGETIIRVNARDSAFFADDMVAVMTCRPNAVLLPKTNEPEDVLAVVDLLDEAGDVEDVKVWAMMETPLGILNAAAIARLGRTDKARLSCFVVGLNDLRKDTGVAPDPQRTYLVPFLMQVILAARAYGITAIDSVSNDFRDLALFELECAQGRAMGFDGKMLIHPAQIEAANRHFGPSEADLAEARAVVEIFADPANRELNVVNSGGRMIERLHLNQAEQLLAKAAAIHNRKGNSA